MCIITSKMIFKALFNYFKQLFVAASPESRASRDVTRGHCYTTGGVKYTSITMATGIFFRTVCMHVFRVAQKHRASP